MPELKASFKIEKADPRLQFYQLLVEGENTVRLEFIFLIFVVLMEIFQQRKRVCFLAAGLQIQ